MVVGTPESGENRHLPIPVGVKPVGLARQADVIG
jgi:hypothetical protein